MAVQPQDTCDVLRKRAATAFALILAVHAGSEAARYSEIALKGQGSTRTTWEMEDMLSASPAAPRGVQSHPLCAVLRPWRSSPLTCNEAKRKPPNGCAIPSLSAPWPAVGPGCQECCPAHPRRQPGGSAPAARSSTLGGILGSTARLRKPASHLPLPVVTRRNRGPSRLVKRWMGLGPDPSGTALPCPSLPSPA